MQTVVTRYPALREALAPEFADVADDALETAIPALLGQGVEAGEAEEFLGGLARSVGRFVSQNPMVGALAKGAAGGALTGAPLGPLGALGGAVVGGLGGALGGRGGPGRRGSAAPGGGAARQLLALLAHPDAQRALAQLALGRAGRSTVQVGRRRMPVPAGAFSNLLGVLAAQATAEYAADQAEAEDAEVLADSYLEADPTANPADPYDRGRALWTLLASEPPPQGVPPAAPNGQVERREVDEDLEAELAELAEAESAEAADDLEAAAWWDFAAAVSR